MNSFSQTLRQSNVTPYAEFGAYSINHVDVFSFSSNQASLAQLKSAQAGVYAERRFMLNELSKYSMAIAIPNRSGSMGFKANYSGSTNYNVSQLGFAYARGLGNKMDVGVQFNYHSFSVPTYGSASTVTAEVGAIFHISEKWHTGFHVNNPVGGRFNKSPEEKLSSQYDFGIGYEASNKFFISAALEKEENQPLNVTAGMQYKPVSQLLVRAGVSTATGSFWAGAGLFINQFRIDITSSFHSQLGVSPGLMIVYSFAKKEN